MTGSGNILSSRRSLSPASLSFLAAALVALSLFALPAATAHKFYTSISHVEYNQETKSLEVAVRVFSDDLEVALTKRNNKAIYLDATKDVGAIITAYLQDVFEIKGRDGEHKKIRWVGMETKVDATWLYFEVKLPEGLAGAELRNRLFFELFTEQVNIINFVDGDKKLDFAFKRGDEFKSLSASESVPAK
jgi:hypothetical protein